MICEKCKKHVYFLEKCNYCNRLICRACMKSVKRVKKVKRLVICKTCWSSIPLRKQFKSA